MTSLFKKSMVAGVLTVAVLGGVPIAPAHAQSNASLQAQIAQLLATINQLQARLNATNSNTPYANYVWTRSLTLGSTGEDVRMLQKFLNSNADTRVAVSGVGSAGMETTYFGPATKAAVIKFQNKYRADVLTPNGLSNGTGYFGPASIAKANMLVKVTTTPNPNPGNNNGSSDLEGEGTLDRVELDSPSDTSIREGEGDVSIAELTLEATDGDIKISRLDLALVANGSNAEKDPWKVFEDVSLWVDGEKIAEKSLDSRNDYLDEDDGTFRLSNINLILEEGEEVEIEVAATVKSNVDGAGTSANWSVSADSVRYFDADGVSTTDTTTGDLGDSVSFDIVEQGDGEELKFSLGENNPAAGTIIVDDTTKTTGKTILEYDIEAIDGDIELDRLYVNIETGTASFSNVVDDVRLVIDGKTFRDDSLVTTGSYSNTNVLVGFEIDGDVTIDEDATQTVEVIIDFKAQTGYQNGETVIARITSTERDMTKAEGADDINSFSGSIVGKEQTLLSEGITVAADSVEFETDTQGQNDTIGIFTIEFEVTAIEDDFYFKDLAGTSTSASTGGIKFQVESLSGTPTSVTGTIDTTADENTPGVFTVREGRTETVTVKVVVDADASTQHRVALENIFFSANTNGVTDAQTYNLVPTNEYRTPYLYIQN